MLDDDETRELVPLERPSMLVRPVATADEMRGAITEYEELKAAILRPGDIQVIKGRPHVKKAGWLRIARAFGISCAPVHSEHIIDDTTGDWGYEVIMRATAPNGAEMTGDGACWASEKHESMRTRHNVRAHAFTRATNRAISNLVGAGEVSAEELTDYVDADPAPRAQPDLRPVPKPIAKRTDTSTDTSTDVSAQIRGLALEMELTDKERGDVFKRYKGQKGQLNLVLAELRTREKIYELRHQLGLDAEEYAAVEKRHMKPNEWPNYTAILAELEARYRAEQTGADPEATRLEETTWKGRGA